MLPLIWEWAEGACAHTSGQVAKGLAACAASQSLALMMCDRLCADGTCADGRPSLVLHTSASSSNLVSLVMSNIV